MKKHIILLAAVAVTLMACDQNASKNAAAERNKKTALTVEDAYQKRNVEDLFKYYAPGFEEFGSGEMGSEKNIDVLKASMKSFFTAFPDFSVENMKAVAEGDSVIVTGLWSGTFTNEFMGIKPNNKKFRSADADIYVFNKEGKIISHRSIQSQNTFLVQLGIPLTSTK